MRVEKSKTTTSGTSGASAFARAFSSAGGATGKTGAAGRHRRVELRFTLWWRRRVPRGGGRRRCHDRIDLERQRQHDLRDHDLRQHCEGEALGRDHDHQERTVSRHKLFPGDEVVIAGAQGSKGTVAATSVTDSGTRSTSTSSTAVHGHQLGHQRCVGDQIALRRRLRPVARDMTWNTKGPTDT